LNSTGNGEKLSSTNGGVLGGHVPVGWS